MEWARLEVANLQAVVEKRVAAEAVVRFRLEALSERSRSEEAHEARTKAEMAERQMSERHAALRRQYDEIGALTASLKSALSKSEIEEAGLRRQLQEQQRRSDCADNETPCDRGRPEA